MRNPFLRNLTRHLLLARAAAIRAHDGDAGFFVERNGMKMSRSRVSNSRMHLIPEQTARKRNNGRAYGQVGEFPSDAVRPHPSQD